MAGRALEPERVDVYVDVVVDVDVDDQAAHDRGGGVGALGDGVGDGWHPDAGVTSDETGHVRSKVGPMAMASAGSGSAAQLKAELGGEMHCAGAERRARASRRRAARRRRKPDRRELVARAAHSLMTACLSIVTPAADQMIAIVVSEAGRAVGEQRDVGAPPGEQQGAVHAEVSDRRRARREAGPELPAVAGRQRNTERPQRSARPGSSGAGSPCRSRRSSAGSVRPPVGQRHGEATAGRCCRGHRSDVHLDRGVGVELGPPEA